MQLNSMVRKNSSLISDHLNESLLSTFRIDVYDLFVLLCNVLELEFVDVKSFFYTSIYTGCPISFFYTLNSWYDNNTDIQAIEMLSMYSLDVDIRYPIVLICVAPLKLTNYTFEKKNWGFSQFTIVSLARIQKINKF